jgi:hypothetical protein
MKRTTTRWRTRLLLLISLIYLGLMVLPVLVNADGDVEERPATKEEKEFYKTVQATIAQALPANAPAGWEEAERSPIKELSYVPAVEEPLRVEYYVAWRDSARISAAEEATQEALRQQYFAQQAQPGTAEMDKLNAQMEKLSKELMEAINAGDMKKAMEIQAEMEKIAEKMKGIYGGRAAEQEKLIEEMAPRDVKARIYVAANSFDEWLGSTVKQEASVAGGLVYRNEGGFSRERGEWVEGYTYIFLGNWKYKEDGGYRYMAVAKNKGLPRTAVQTIVVKIQADPARTEELMKKIDWERLKKLIKQ